MKLAGWLYGLGLAWAIGFSMVSPVVGRAAGEVAASIFRLALALIVGLVATGTLRYAIAWLGISSPAAVVSADHLLLAFCLVALLLARRVAPRRGSQRPAGRSHHGPRFQSAAWLLVFVILILAVGQIGAAIRVNPFGLADAITVWNVKALAVYAGRDRWLDLLRTTGHPDYPLLLPATLARLSAYSGGFSETIPQWTAISIFVTVGVLLAGALAEERGAWLAVPAVAVLGACPGFPNVSASLYADALLSALVLATSVSLWRCATVAGRAAGWAALTGLLAAGAAWTKNEGLVLLVASGCAIAYLDLAVPCRTRGEVEPWFRSRRLPAWLLAALPITVLSIHFKLAIGAESWLLRGRPALDLWEAAATPERYHVIARTFLALASSFVSPGMLVLFAVALVALPPARDPVFWRTWIVVALVVLLLLASYVLIYAITPFDLGWHLLTSAERVAAHLWPTALFLSFVLVTPRVVGRGRRT